MVSKSLFFIFNKVWQNGQKKTPFLSPPFLVRVFSLVIWLLALPGVGATALTILFWARFHSLLTGRLATGPDSTEAEAGISGCREVPILASYKVHIPALALIDCPPFRPVTHPSKTQPPSSVKWVP